MDLAVAGLVRAIHAAAPPYALAVTGGGAGAVASLLAVPGGSRSLLEAVVPYNEQALADYLGRRPTSFCSAATSRDMARQAHEQ